MDVITKVLGSGIGQFGKEGLGSVVYVVTGETHTTGHDISWVSLKPKLYLLFYWGS